MKRKKLFISLTAVCAVLVFLGIFVLMWYVGDSYKDFKKFSKEFAIEGLDDGAVPQGMTAYPSNYVYDVDETGKEKVKLQQYFLVSSYMSDGSASRIYVTVQLTDNKNKVTGYRYIGFVTLENEDGTPHLGHVGGIATNGAFLWVGHDDNVLVATASSKDYENILREIILKAQINLSGEAEEIQSVKFTSSFKANCNASFMVYFDDARYTDITYDRLYVGEFYRKGNYETDKSHRIETPNGYKNTAFMYEYNVDKKASSENPYGLTRIDQDEKDKTLSDNVPKIQKIFSIPEKIQGVAFSGRKGSNTTSSDPESMVVLSQSYGLANSHLLCFDWKLATESANRELYRSIAGESFAYKDVYRNRSNGDKTPYTDSGVYVYYLDKNNEKMFVNDYSVPSMSEGMCTATRAGANAAAITDVYVLFESGSKKYNFFTRESIKDVFRFVPTFR